MIFLLNILTPQPIPIDFTDDQDDNEVLDLVGLTVTGIGIVLAGWGILQA